ncbi:regulator of G-protein signaling 22 [Corythoichthys intestinalis]|uniref:regulator of G-protein signaling 22 n=1 Tax=Corythoichthys intestinalis TaxID=161448 RepID=UPI0025A623B5|nr:regulator of G-protein signaling 22 [Corythoichthys intestinalis]
MLNKFLSLPCFPQALLYNWDTDQFEVPSRAAEFTFNKIRSALEHSKSQLLCKDVSTLAKSALVDNHYTVSCLERQQGIRWIAKERLTFFLRSRFFHEYRLSKLLFQWAGHINISRKYSSHLPSATFGDKENVNALDTQTGLCACNCNTSNQGCAKIHEPTHTSPGYKGHTHRYLSESSRCFKPSTSSSNQNSANINIKKTAAASQVKQLHEEASDLHLGDLAVQVVQQVVENAIFMLKAQKQGNKSDLFNMDTNCKYTGWPCSVNENTKAPCQECQKWSQASWSTDFEMEICYHNGGHLGNQPGMDDFKLFLRGTQGGKLLNLWLDIETLKAINSERKKSFLALIRSRYLLRSSQNSLNMDLLCRLGLATSPCWTKERLCSIQPSLMESISSYWIPRYWTSQHMQINLYYYNIEQRKECCISPHFALLTSQSIFSESWSSRSLHKGYTQRSRPSRTQSYGCTRLEDILQALFVDPDAGSYFTHFCEQSGNQLWQNAVYFWNDLQHYHELFYQDGLDPYRVQRVAQVLYYTYIHSSASRSIRLKEAIRKEVSDHLIPAFEELFDQVEDHILSILMEAWTVLVGLDKKSFLQVCVYEDVRYVDTWEHRELQRLYSESMQNINQLVQKSMTSPSNNSSRFFSQGHLDFESWSNVPSQYQGYRLGSLLRHHQEIWHFMSFLENEDASIHLECWLDMEQYRRIPQTNKAVRQARSSHIARKYLNGNYFFGSQSPATEEEQNNILHLTGGLELLKRECLSKTVTVEIQDIIRAHIEKTWLPQFLATREFTERQKGKPKDSSQRQKTRKGWKSQDLWMSSSTEILLFRRFLLNPTSCLQFQHFVSCKGGFLENDLLFWLEVQRYKDLCHSHSDEATIQQKISTIIKCFINSSRPPALQIDIPLEQAQSMREKRHKLGPYIFREAQMSVFSELLKFWPEFQELRSSVHEDQLLERLLDERLKHKARVRRQRRKEEEDEARRAKEDVKSLDSSSGEDADVRNDDDGGVEKRRGESRDSKTPSGLMPFTQVPLSWSYSKYMAALKREEVLLRRQSQKEASFSTYSASSDSSVRSTGSRHSHRSTSQHSSRSRHGK